MLGRQVAAQDRRRRVQPDPGRHQLPEPDQQGPRRPGLRPVLQRCSPSRPRGWPSVTTTPSSQPAGGGPDGLRAEPAQLLLRAARPDDPVRRRLRRLHPVAPGVAASQDRGLRRARRPVLGADRREHPGQVRGGRHQDRLQAGLPVRDAGPLAGHGGGRRDEAGRDRGRHAERGRVRAGQEPGPAEVQPEVHVPCPTAPTRRSSSPTRSATSNTEGIFSSGDWFPGSTASGSADFTKAYIAKYGGTAQQIDDSSAEAYAVGPADRGGRRRRPARSTTPRSSAPCTAAPGRPSSATSRWDANGAPTGTLQPGAVAGRQAASGLPGRRGAGEADRIPSPTGAGDGDACPRSRASSSGPDGGRLRADGLRPDPDLRRHEGGQPGPGGDGDPRAPTCPTSCSPRSASTRSWRSR